MMNLQLRSAASGVAVMLFALAGNVQAAPPGPGQGLTAATLSSTAFITVSGSTVTFTLPSAPVTIATSSNSGTLLGISGIWVVDHNGNAISGITASQGAVTTAGGTATSWNSLVSSGNYIGFHDDSSGSGFGGHDAWLQLASNSVVNTGSGKTGSGDVLGTFTFSGLNNLSSYTFAVDYLASWNGGQTGRGLLTNYTSASTPDPVPEPGILVTGASMAGMTLLGLMRGRRRIRQISSVS